MIIRNNNNVKKCVNFKNGQIFLILANLLKGRFYPYLCKYDLLPNRLSNLSALTMLRLVKISVQVLMEIYHTWICGSEIVVQLRKWRVDVLTCRCRRWAAAGRAGAGARGARGARGAQAAGARAAPPRSRTRGCASASGSSLRAATSRDDSRTTP